MGAQISFFRFTRNMVCRLASLRFRPLAIISTFVLVSGLSLNAYAQVSFENVTSELGPFHKGESWGAAWGDINGDYYPDISANNHRHRHSLWVNQGGQNFVERILQFDRSRVLTTDVNQDNHGSTFADIDNDGDQDMINARSSAGGRALIFLNNQGVGTESGSSLISRVTAGRMATFYDYDRDGRLDMFYASSIRSSNRVYRYSGSSYNFASPSGFSDKCRRVNYYQFSSVDNDTSGLQNLDITCATEGNFPLALFDASAGNNNFQDETSTIPNSSITVDSVYADFDNDGDTDVLALRGAIRGNGASLVSPTKIESWFISSNSAGAKSFTFQSSGSITIRSLDIARDSTPVDQIRIGGNNNSISSLPITLDKNSSFAQGISNSSSKGVYIGYDPATSKWKARFLSTDFEDYYLVLEGDGLTEPADLQVKTRDLPIAPQMIKNSGGVFARDFSVGLNDPVSCASVVAGDFDNDMDLDLYFACSGGVENYPNRLYLNDGTGDFTAVTTSYGGEGIVGKGLDDGAGVAESVVMADYDLDGRLDLFTTNGALFVPEFRGGPDELLRNTTVNSNNWIQLDLIGVSVNRDAVGAKITATTGGVTQTREQNGGYHRWSQNHQRIHFGLGPNQIVDITVDWPDGTQDTFSGLAANGLYELTQGQSAQQVVLTGEYNSYPAPQAGEECSNQGQVFIPELDKGVFLYKDCGSGNWHLSAVSGGSPDTINFSGTILSGQPIPDVDEVDIEGADFVNVSGRRIDFSLNVKNANIDEFEFNLGATLNACIQVDGSAPFYVGEGHLPAPNSLDLIQMGACDLNVDGSLNVPISNSVSITTAPFTIPGSGGNATQTIDLSTTGAQIGQTVLVNNLIADGDLDRQNGSDERFSLNFNNGEFQANTLYTDGECEGSLQPVTMPINQNIGVIDIGNGVPGIEIYGSTTPQVRAGCINVQYSLTITVEQSNNGDNVLVCGEPDFSSANDRGVYVWKDCAGSGDWHINGTAGGGSVITYEGTFSTDTEFQSVTPESFEGFDYFSLFNASKQLDFGMRMANSGIDKLQYSLALGSDLCLTLTDPNQIIRVGSEGTAFVSPLNLTALNNSCLTSVSAADKTVDEGIGSVEVAVSLSDESDELVSISYATADGSAVAGQDYQAVSGTLDFQPGETTQLVSIPIVQDSDVEASESFSLILSNPTNVELIDNEAEITINDDEVAACGKPTFSSATDAGVFLWQDCAGNGNWFVQATAGGSSQAIDYMGDIVSDSPISSLATFSFEGVDTAELSNGDQQLDFRMKMAGSGIDGIEFSAMPGATCIDVAEPAGTSIVVGSDGAIISPPFDIHTFDPC